MDDSLDDNNKALTQPQLNKAEGGVADKPSDTVGKGYNPTDKSETSRVKAIASGISNNRRGIAFGGGGGGIVVAIIVAIFAIGAHALVNLEHVVLHDAARIEQRFEQKEAQKLMDKIANKATNKALAAKEVTDAEEVAGEKLPLTEEVDEFPLEGEQAALAKGSINLHFDSAGNLTSVTNGDGQNITDNFTTEESAGLESALPEWNVGQLEVYRPFMTQEAQVSFDFWSDPSESMDQALEDNVLNGANNSEIAQAAQEEEENNPPTQQNGETTSQFNAQESAYQQDQSLTKPLQDAVAATEQEFKQSGNEQVAEDDGVNTFESEAESGGSTLLVTGIATMACSIFNAVSHTSNQRVPSIITLLMRHGNLLLTAATEEQLGKLNSKQVSSLGKLLNGTGATKSNTSATNTYDSSSSPKESSLPFTAAASYRRAVGSSVNTDSKSPGYTPDTSQSALPTTNAGTNIVNDIRSLGVGSVCGVLTGAFSIVFQGIIGIGQIAADIESFGAFQAGTIAANLGFQQTINRVILPDVLKYFTNLSITGTEDAVQWTNNSAAGLHLSFNDYSRRIGAKPITDAQASQLANAATQDEINTNAQQSFFYRNFAISNPLSITSELINKLPVSVSSTFTNIGSELISLPETMLHNFSTIFSRPAFAADSALTSNPYSATTYAFTDNEIGKYDPVANEAYLYSKVAVPLANGGTQEVRRIDALGNPTTFSGVDTSTADLLHCFVDSYTDIMENNNNAANLCGDVGNLSSDPSPAGGYTPSSQNGLPGDEQAAEIYCNYAGVTSLNNATCANQMIADNLLNDDVGHFRQYLLDTHIMDDYESITNSQ